MTEEEIERMPLYVQLDDVASDFIGAQVACFTRTKVQILAQELQRARVALNTAALADARLLFTTLFTTSLYCSAFFFFATYYWCIPVYV